MLPRIPSDDNYFKYLGFLRTGEQPKRPMVFDISTPPPSGNNLVPYYTWQRNFDAVVEREYAINSYVWIVNPYTMDLDIGRVIDMKLDQVNGQAVIRTLTVVHVVLQGGRWTDSARVMTYPVQMVEDMERVGFNVAFLGRTWVPPPRRSC